MNLRLILLLSLLPGLAVAAGPPDPDWPCIQRRQPQLSLAQVWAGPPPDEAATEQADRPDVQRVAKLIALRRTSTDEAERLIADFAATADGPAMVGLFVATFDHIQTARNRVMAGITRYAHKQEALDSHIQENRHAFEALMAADSPDFNAIDKIEEDIDWSTRIFQDRQQSLTYVCETPVILEQRAFALGRIVVAHMPK